MRNIHRDPFLFIVCLCVLSSSVLSNLIISKADRKIDLTSIHLASHIARSTTTLKVENSGNGPASEVLLPFPDINAKNLAFLRATIRKGEGKSKTSSSNLPLKAVNADGRHSWTTGYAVSLPSKLGKGESLTLEVKAVFIHSLLPYPKEATPASGLGVQLFHYSDTAYYFSPYSVKAQSLTVKLPESKSVDFYRLRNNPKQSGSELKYGPYQNIRPFQYLPISFIGEFSSNTEIVVAVNGTVYQIEMELHSINLSWKFMSGPSIYSPFQANHNSSTEGENFYIDCDEDGKLYLYHGDNVKRVEIPTQSVDEFLRHTPYILPGGLMLGSKKATAFLVNSKTGKVISDMFGDNETSNDLGDWAATSTIYYPPYRVMRTDYALKYISTKTGKVLWSLLFADFEASRESRQSMLENCMKNPLDQKCKVYEA